MFFSVFTPSALHASSRRYCGAVRSVSGSVSYQLGTVCGGWADAAWRHAGQRSGCGGELLSHCVLTAI